MYKILLSRMRTGEHCMFIYLRVESVQEFDSDG